MTKQTIVLNMIVKNGAQTIVRALESAAPHVDRVVILDTGSTDDTVDVIARTCGRLGLPVTIQQETSPQPFDFARARNRALDIVRKIVPDLENTYILFLDADDYIHYDPTGDGVARLTADSYQVKMHCGIWSYSRTALVRADLPWEWRLPRHEGLYLADDRVATVETLPCVTIMAEVSGTRDPIEDAKMLDQYEGPQKPRAIFYAAQAYHQGGQVFEAQDRYKARIKCRSGWDEEVFYSWFMLGLISTQVGECTMALNMAIQMRPARLEPYWAAVQLCKERGWDNLARMYLDSGVRYMGDPQSREGLFVDTKAPKGLRDYYLELHGIELE